MNIPGFTAEASLYGKSGNYRTAGAHTQADGAIQPAIFDRSQRPSPYECARCTDECLRACPFEEPYYICKHNCNCACCIGGHPYCEFM